MSYRAGDNGWRMASSRGSAASTRSARPHVAALGACLCLFAAPALADGPGAVDGAAAGGVALALLADDSRSPGDAAQPAPVALSGGTGGASRFNLRELLRTHRWRRFTREEATQDGAALLGKVTVVEVQEVTVGAAPRRPRHALRVQSRWANQWMRSMGFDASDCAMQLRAPTKFGQTRDGVKFHWQAQVRLGCNF